MEQNASGPIRSISLSPSLSFPPSSSFAPSISVGRPFDPIQNDTHYEFSSQIAFEKEPKTISEPIRPVSGASQIMQQLVNIFLILFSLRVPLSLALLSPFSSAHFVAHSS